MTDPSWNFMDVAAKDRLLGVLQREIDDTFALVADPERWQAPTACEHWEARDVIGHLVDTTEGYLPNFELARSGTESSTEPFSIGVRTSGNNGGEVRMDVSPEGVQYAPGDVSGCDAVMEFDPATLVLAGYGRMNGGTVRGDAAVADRFRSMIVPI